jgi:hypothetical protein
MTYNDAPLSSLHRSPRCRQRPCGAMLRRVVSRGVRMAATTVLSTVAIAQTPRPQPSFEFSSAASSLRIPAEVVADGLVLIQAAVNGHTGWFILDNASQGFTVDTEYAKRIWTESSATRRECTDRSTGQCRGFRRPRKDERPCSAIPIRLSQRIAKMENEANKYLVFKSSSLPESQSS